MIKENWKEILTKLLINQLGVSILPDYSVERELEKGELVQA